MPPGGLFEVDAEAGVEVDLDLGWGSLVVVDSYFVKDAGKVRTTHFP